MERGSWGLRGTRRKKEEFWLGKGCVPSCLLHCFKGSASVCMVSGSSASGRGIFKGIFKEVPLVHCSWCWGYFRGQGGYSRGVVNCDTVFLSCILFPPAMSSSLLVDLIPPCCRLRWRFLADRHDAGGARQNNVRKRDCRGG